MNDGTHAYTYDAEGRLVTVDGTAAVYLYDADGRRIRTQTPSLTKDFVFDQFGRNILEFNEATRLERRWEIYAGDRAIATYANATTYWNHPDPLGTVRLRTKVDGTEYQRCANLPFGDASNCSNTTFDPTFFTGQERDTEDNLDHFQFRNYSSTAGSWMTPDPAGLAAADLSNPQSLNRYAYVGNNPINYIDPLGLHWECVSESVDGVKVGESCTYVDDGPLPSDGGGGSAPGGAGPIGGSGGGGGGTLQKVGAAVKQAATAVKNAYCTAIPSGRSTSLGRRHGLR